MPRVCHVVRAVQFSAGTNSIEAEVALCCLTPEVLRGAAPFFLGEHANHTALMVNALVGEGGCPQWQGFWLLSIHLSDPENQIGQARYAPIATRMQISSTWFSLALRWRLVYTHFRLGKKVVKNLSRVTVVLERGLPVTLLVDSLFRDPCSNILDACVKC